MEEKRTPQLSTSSRVSPVPERSKSTNPEGKNCHDEENSSSSRKTEPGLKQKASEEDEPVKLGLGLKTKGDSKHQETRRNVVRFSAVQDYSNEKGIPQLIPRRRRAQIKRRNRFQQETEKRPFLLMGHQFAFNTITKQWKSTKCIIKKLAKSDVDINTSRLLIPYDKVMAHIMPFLSYQQKNEIRSCDGMAVVVRDLDIGSELNLRFNGRQNSYVLRSGWRRFFVKWRCLKEKDVIGLSFDGQASRFDFAVLPEVQNRLCKGLNSIF